jgi:hypothetical protein
MQDVVTVRAFAFMISVASRKVQGMAIREPMVNPSAI